MKLSQIVLALAASIASLDASIIVDDPISIKGLSKHSLLRDDLDFDGLSKNLVKNPSFENKLSAKPWKLSGDGVYIFESPEVARTGKRSTLFTIKNTKQRPEIYQTIHGVKVGRNYEVSFFFKSLESPPATFTCQLVVQLYGSQTLLGFPAITGPDEKGFTKVTFPFTAPSPDPTLEIISSCSSLTRPVNLVVDDVSLVEVKEAEEELSEIEVVEEEKCRNKCKKAKAGSNGAVLI
ncbi:hypothetical protein F66182_3411 [Fusarium sp. NRRL 66182]|nr:hypothetical protein F66182_3411 [Fusarium sp. NRRL 66182]